MRWLGSKSSVVQAVYGLTAQDNIETVCDPFGGIGVVGAYFKSKGHAVVTGDHLWSAHCFQTATVAADRIPQFKRLRTSIVTRDAAGVESYFNSLSPTHGWFAREYSDLRQFFTTSNARKIDACLNAIAQWRAESLISKREHRILIASLINSMDLVANTAGTYYAYLKDWDRKALRPFCFKLIPATPGRSRCRAVLGEADALVASAYFDLLYLDPPYNPRSYANYYHLPETLARSEKPRPHGIAGVPRVERPRSEYNSRRTATAALQHLLSGARFRILLFHYANDGLIPERDIRALLSACGRVKRFDLDATGYSTRRGRSRAVSHVLYRVTRA